MRFLNKPDSSCIELQIDVRDLQPCDECGRPTLLLGLVISGVDDKEKAVKISTFTRERSDRPGEDNSFICPECEDKPALVVH